MKIVISTCFGGFGLSEEAEDLYAKKAGFEIYRYSYNHDKSADIQYIRYIRYKHCGCAQYTFKEDHGDGFKEVSQDDDCWLSGCLNRVDPILVEVVEELGAEASNDYSRLEVFEVPDDVDWEIKDYDGSEHIAEKHRTWGR